MGRAMVAVAGLWAALGAACGTVDIGDPPADVNACRPSQRFFYERVWPEFLGKDHGGKRCSDSRCHDASSSRLLVLPPPQSTPALPLPTDWAMAYKAATEQMLCTNVGESPLIVRPSQSNHGGGPLIDLMGAEADVVRAWVGVK